MTPQHHFGRDALQKQFVMTSAGAIALGAPSNVIAPGKLTENDIDRGPDIEYVLTWGDPGCSRVEVFFNARNLVTGSDAGQMRVTQ